MSRYLKSAFFSALLVWAVAFPVLGLKLSIVGINLEVHGTGPVTLTIIALCSVLMFLRVLFTQQVGALFKGNRGPLVSPKVSQFLTLPSTQRYIIIALIIAALIWPFFGSRGAVDIATLILIYVLLGLGLNIVVGLGRPARPGLRRLLRRGRLHLRAALALPTAGASGSACRWPA